MTARKLNPQVVRHGFARHGRVTPEYLCWRAMMKRCTNQNNKGWLRYGGRGIRVCERWSNFLSFLADMGPRPSRDHSIDRINNDGNYEPSNCRWATRSEQARNRSSNRTVEAFGKRKTLAAWAEELGVDAERAGARLSMGWAPERALTAAPLPPQRGINAGSRHGMSKLTEESVRRMRVRFAEGATLDVLAAEFSTSRSNAHLIVRRKAWAHVA